MSGNFCEHLGMIVEQHVPLEPRPERPRMAGGGSVAAGGVVTGEWSLTAAAWTDRHEHVEINYVLEGELHVTSDGETRVVGTGGFVVVPAGSRARYEAPVHARMLFVYGPADDGGHRTTDAAYDELPEADAG